METRDKSCCFIGHREIRQNDKLTESLRDSILNLINIGVYRFAYYDGRNTTKSKEKSRSGTELAYKYAEKRGLSIQNIYKTD